ncbi:integrin alpha-V-like isoform X3 [Ruditapes philippinarum]|uniref:integrin alpha-V-like isoform X3 n=1 Tax=Ruditapes philippinarum TaxID=129788 RepID=UPI00295B7A70|nr:integrin alpha-V-like isoform X3 [Ruditapes philippinarum]
MELFGLSLSDVCNMCSYHRKCISSSVYYGIGIVLVLLGVICDLSKAYNIDLTTATIHSGETRSMFGFSVALHQDQGSKWLLVGAPKASTRQPGVTRGGAVYRCPVDTGSYCQEIPFDTKGNGIRHNGTHYVDVEDKSDQWFGASLYSSENGIIVACAPRYVYFSTRLDKREPVGTCYVARPSSTDYEEYSPCRSRGRWGYHKEGSCQAGYSVALAEQGRQLLIGAVGSWYWQGQIFNFNFENGPGRYQATKEGRARDDYSYMGFSSAVGNFDSDDKEDYVVGVPRGRQLQGKVVIYTQNLTLIKTIKGEQFGSYFGYSVAVTDLDGNGLDDIVVGAPFFSDFSTDNSYETGRVYIFYQMAKVNGSLSGISQKKKKDIIDGHDSQSRFGLAVAAIGDVDYDGYNDIAIGAPYGGKDGRGVVYIYHGSMKGIITDVQQAIKADDVLSGTETFGWSIAGGIDMDDNEYPDILVGAYNSNKAAFLRSRPVVRVTPTIRIDPQDITLGPENEKCVIGDEMATCVTVYTCVLYAGIGVPGKLDFEVKLKFDSLKNDTSRVYFINARTKREEKKTIEVFKDRQKCFSFFGYLVKNVRDKLTPIVAKFSFDIIERKSRQRREVQPILNMRIPTTVTASANISKNCGKDNVCIPDLSVTAMQTRDSYTLGQDDKIEILVFVENRGEDAFEATLNITFPPGVEFYKNKNIKYEIQMSCSIFRNESYILCDLGNPLPAKSRTNFTLIATPKSINDSVAELILKLQVNSSNAENITDVSNNLVFVNIPIQQRANLRLGGTSRPEQYIYSEKAVRLYRGSAEIGPVLEHEYVLENRGPSGVKTSLLKIEWPGEDENGLKFLEMIDKPIESRTDISCRVYNTSEDENGNETVTTYSDTNGNNPVIVQQRNVGTENQLKRHTRETTDDSDDDNNVEKRDVEKRSSKELKRVGCVTGKAGCVFVQCTIGYMEPKDTVSIKIRSRVWTTTLISKNFAAPFYFVSKGTAEVLSMPYTNMKVATGTYTKTTFDVTTYVNPEKLHPKRRGIEAWIIAVAVSAGLLLLFLLIVLLWWCGFFRRRRPEEQAFLTPAAQNGDYKPVQSGAPDSRYHYM